MSDASPWMEGYNEGMVAGAAAERARIEHELLASFNRVPSWTQFEEAVKRICGPQEPRP